MKEIVKKIMNSINAVGFEFHSGGGFFHNCFMLLDGRILIHHISENDFEITYNKWPSIQDYLDDPEGFGYEYTRPFYEKRTFSLGKKSIMEDELKGKLFELINYKSETNKQTHMLLNTEQCMELAADLAIKTIIRDNCLESRSDLFIEILGHDGNIVEEYMLDKYRQNYYNLYNFYLTSIQEFMLHKVGEEESPDDLEQILDDKASYDFVYYIEDDHLVVGERSDKPYDVVPSIANSSYLVDEGDDYKPYIFYKDVFQGELYVTPSKKLVAVPSSDGWTIFFDGEKVEEVNFK